jgi:hypothetical protein
LHLRPIFRRLEAPPQNTAFTAFFLAGLENRKHRLSAFFPFFLAVLEKYTHKI